MERDRPATETLLYGFCRLLVIPALLYYPVFVYFVVTAPRGQTTQYAEITQWIQIFLITPVTILLGSFIIRRVPRHVIGPALIVFAVFMNAEVIHARQLPTWQSALNATLLSSLALPAFFVILVHFPTGRIYVKQLSPLVYTLVGTMWVFGLFFLFGSPTAYGTDFAYGEVRPNPFFVPWLQATGTLVRPAADLLSTVIFASIIVLQIYRYVTTSFSERKQMRWLVFGLLVAIIPSLIQSNLSLIVFTGFIPFTIAASVLFHRLWDIDVIIRRTLVYSLVSLLLALVYFSLVVTAQRFLADVIRSNNQPVLVVTTLVVVVLFNPVRQRVQRVVDRLFYRRRYDAEATLRAFTVQVRDAMHPDTIRQQLLQATTEALLPTTVGFWMAGRATTGRTSASEDPTAKLRD